MLRRAEPGTSAKSQIVHLAAVDPITRTGRGGRYKRAPGESLCSDSWQRHGLWPVDQVVTCRQCLAAADRYGVAVIIRWHPVLRLAAVRSFDGRGTALRQVHYRAEHRITTPRFQRDRGELLCKPRPERHLERWLVIAATVTCPMCCERATYLGIKPRAPRRGSCTEPGCAFRWRFGESRPCPQHTAEPMTTPYMQLRQRIALDVASALTCSAQ